jgi:hypothetical protein
MLHHGSGDTLLLPLFVRQPRQGWPVHRVGDPKMGLAQVYSDAISRPIFAYPTASRWGTRTLLCGRNVAMTGHAGHAKLAMGVLSVR